MSQQQRGFVYNTGLSPPYLCSSVGEVVSPQIREYRQRGLIQRVAKLGYILSEMPVVFLSFYYRRTLR
jgi:hypothetical protein